MLSFQIPVIYLDVGGRVCSFSIAHLSHLGFVNTDISMCWVLQSQYLITITFNYNLSPMNGLLNAKYRYVFCLLLNDYTAVFLVIALKYDVIHELAVTIT